MGGRQGSRMRLAAAYRMRPVGAAARALACMLALLLATGQLLAQSAPSQEATRGLRPPAAVKSATDSLRASQRGILFRVIAPAVPDGKRAGATSAGYLFGTIHFGSAQEQGIDFGQLVPLLAPPVTFVNEADVDSRWQPAFDRYRWLPPGKSLKAWLGEKGLADAGELLPNIARRDLQRMRPWAVLALLEARGEHDDGAGLDARLQHVAAGAGLRIVHLESLEQQLKALDCVPPAEHATVLAQRLRKPWFLQMDSAEAMAAYRNRDLGAWFANIERMDGLDAAAREIEQRARVCLIEDRNARWFGTLEEVFRSGPAFVAVGALHLPGPDGLIARLRAAGFTVEPMPL